MIKKESKIISRGKTIFHQRWKWHRLVPLHKAVSSVRSSRKTLEMIKLRLEAHGYMSDHQHYFVIQKALMSWDGTWECAASILKEEKLLFKSLPMFSSAPLWAGSKTLMAKRMVLSLLER